MLYANRRFLVSVIRAEEDGELLTPEFTVPVLKGNYIGTDQCGNQFVLTEEHFLANYIAVEKVKPKRKREKSPFEIEEAYKQNWVGTEEEQYINGMYKISENNN